MRAAQTCSSILVLLCSAACTPVRPAVAPPPATPIAAASPAPVAPAAGAWAPDERTRLGHLDDVLDDVDAERRRLWRIAELELAAGDRSAAIAAARTALDAAEALAAAAGILGVDEAAAERELDDVIAHTAELAAAAGNEASLLLPIVRLRPAGAARWRTQIRASILAEPYFWRHQPVAAPLAELFAGDTLIAALLETDLLRRSQRGTGVPDAALAALGELGVESARDRLTTALESAELARIGAAAGVLLRCDPLDARALALRLLLDDMAAGHVRRDAGLLAAFKDVRWPELNLLRREAAAPGAPAGVALAFAYAARAAGLAGDALRTASAVAARADRASITRAVADEIVALSALELGRGEEFEKWRTGVDPAWRSAWVVEHVLSIAERDQAPLVLVNVARGALAARFAAPLPPELVSTWSWRAQQAVADPELPEKARVHALDVVRRASPDNVPVLASCMRDRLSRGDCLKRLTVVAELMEGEGLSEESPGRGLGSLRVLPAAALEGVDELSEAQLRELAPQIDEMGKAPGAQSAALLSARLRLMLLARRFDEVRALLAGPGALLPPGERIAARLILADLRQGKLAPENAREALVTPPDPWELAATCPAAGTAAAGSSDDDDDSDEDDGEDGDRQAKLGSGRVAALDRATRGLWQQAPSVPALESLLALADGSDPELDRLLAHTVHVAARSCGFPELRRRAVERLASAPGSRHAVAMQAAEALEAKRPAEARPMLARLIALRDGWVEGAELAEAGREDASAAAWRRAAGRFGPGRLQPRASGDEGPVKDRESWRAMLRLRGSPAAAFEAGPDLADAAGAFAVSSWIRGRLGSIAPGQLVSFARQAAIFLADGRGPLAGELKVWSLWLAGDIEAVRRADPEGEGVPARLAGLKRLPRPRDRQDIYRAMMLGADGAARARAAEARAEKAGAGPDRTVWQQLACAQFGEASRAEDAVPICAAAWRAAPADPTVAGHLSWALLQAPDTARLRHIDVAAFFTEAVRRQGASASSALAANHVVWLLDQNRWPEAATAMERYWDAGHGDQDSGIDVNQLGLARFAPVLIRYRAARARAAQPVQQQQALATAATMAGDLELASLHLTAAHALRGEQPAGDGAEGFLAMADLNELAAADLKESRLSREQVAELMSAIMTSRQKEAAEMAGKMVGKPGGSYLARIVTIEAKQDVADTPALAELAGRFPGNGVVILDLVVLLSRQGRAAEAREHMARLKRLHPDDVRLARVEIPAPPAERGPLPAWLARPEALAAVLEKADVDGALKKDVKRRVGLERNAEIFLPASITEQQDMIFAGEGLGMGVVLEPRVTSCVGDECLDAIVTQFQMRGSVRHWTRRVSLPAGEGWEVLFSTTAGVSLVTVLPIGAQLFELWVTAEPERLRKALPVVRLLRETFRPLDAVVGTSQAEALRGAAPLPGDEVRARARLVAQLAPGRGCPLPGLLSGLEAVAQQGGLLLDLMLATPAAAGRRALLECVDPARQGFALAASSLLDADDRVRELGMTLAARYPDETVRQARAVLSGSDEGAVSQKTPGRETAPRFGLLQILRALPPKQRAELAGAMLAGTPGQRALALVAPRIAPDSTSPEELARLVRRGSVSEALAAASGMQEPLPSGSLDAARERLAASRAPASAAEARLVSRLAGLLVRSGDPSDLARLERVQAMLRSARGDAARRAAALERTLRSMIEARRERAGWRAQEVPQAAALPGRVAVSADVLALEPLSALLPASGWSYVRIPQPALFAASAVSLFRRLPAADPRGAIAVRVLAELAAKTGIEMLTPAGGLDLSRPIECGFVAAGEDSVCAAHVSEPAAARALVDRTAAHGDGALDLPVEIGLFASGVAMLAPALPIFLHHNLSDESTAGGAAQLERLRETVEIAGVPMTRDTVVRIRGEGGASVDSRVTWLHGRRLWVFSSAEVARAVLGRSSSSAAVLGASPVFQRLARDWAGGTALQMLVSEKERGQEEQYYGLEAVAASTGLKLRMRAQVTGVPGDLRPVWAALPEGAVSRMALATEPEVLDSGGKLDLPPASDAGNAPPLWLGSTAREGALGWYPESGQALWSGWVVVVRWNEGCRRAWLEHRLPEPAAGKPGTRAGMHFSRRDDLVIVASSRALLDRALAAQTAPPDTRRYSALGHLDGERAGAVLDAMAERLQSKGENQMRSGSFRVFGAMSRLVRQASMASWVDAATGEVETEATLAPSLRDEGADSVLIDQLLANAGRARNSLRLPRPVPAAELERPLKLVLEVASPDEARRAFPGAPRLQLAALGGNRWRITTGAPAPAGEGEPLGFMERRKWTRADNEMKLGPSVRAASGDAIPSGATPAQAVDALLAWLPRHLRYEMTPEVLDDAAVLARGRGDCTEWSKLAVALLRASGVPARTRMGFLIDGDQLIAHAWAEYHDGRRWYEFDPTNRRASVNAGYIDASVLEVMSLVSMGRLRLVGLE